MGKKAILIHGVGRSGTTYLMFQLIKNNEIVFCEPTHPWLDRYIALTIGRKYYENSHFYWTKELY